MYTIPITTEVLSRKHQSQSGPTLPSTWAHCHAHSLRAAARCQVHVLTSGIIIWKIHTQGLHTPPPQTYSIPIMTEVLSGKHQSQSTPPSAPTLSSTWAHCHAHSLRAAARCQLHVPTSVIIIWKIHTQGLHTPTPPTYTIPIMTEILSAKYEIQYAPPSAPTQSNTWAHCHAHVVPSSRSRGHTSTTDRPVHTGAVRATGHNAPPCSPYFHPETATTIPGSGTMLGTLTKPNVGEHTQDTTREFQWRQTNCACAFYCVKGQYIVFQPTTTAICRTCTVVIK